MACFVVSSSTTLDMIGLLSSRNTTYQDLAEAAVRLVVLVKKRKKKKSVLECFFSFAAVDAREALLCRLFLPYLTKSDGRESPRRSIDKKFQLFYYFIDFPCNALWLSHRSLRSLRETICVVLNHCGLLLLFIIIVCAHLV